MNLRTNVLQAPNSIRICFISQLYFKSGSQLAVLYRGDFAKSGDTFSGHNWGKGCYELSVQRLGMQLHILQCTGLSLLSPTKQALAQNVNSVLPCSMPCRFYLLRIFQICSVPAPPLPPNSLFQAFVTSPAEYHNRLLTHILAT